MSSIAIITARGGSKRIYKKNIKEFCGKPIIAYSIEAAFQSGIFQKIMVSTDCMEIAEIAKAYGAEVPFMRSEATSDDFADTTDVLLEVLNEYKCRENYFDDFCCIYPTAPFINGKKLCESHQMLSDDDVFNVIPMAIYSYPPQRGMKKDGKYIIPVHPEYINYRSQDLEEIYHDCGQFYWCKTKEFFKNTNFLSNCTAAYVVSEMEVQDIDNESDWELAEVKYHHMREGKK